MEELRDEPLSVQRKRCIEAARGLLYPEIVVKQLKKAKDEQELYRIMRNARDRYLK